MSKIIEQSIVQTIIKSFVLSNSNDKLNGMFFTVITIDITIIFNKCSIYIYITQASLISLVWYFSFPSQFLGTFKSLESVSCSQQSNHVKILCTKWCYVIKLNYIYFPIVIFLSLDTLISFLTIWKLAVSKSCKIIWNKVPTFNTPSSIGQGNFCSD